MSDVTADYNLKAIRELLLAAFTPQDLNRFCQDRPFLKPVVARFGPGHGLDDMVDEVVTYCEAFLFYPELLTELEEYNPRQHARFFGREPDGGDIQEPEKDTAAEPASRILTSEEHEMATAIVSRTHEDFTLAIQTAGEGRYHVEASGPAGEAEAYFALPFDDKDIEIFLLKVGHPRSMTVRGRVPARVQPTVDFGTKLFDALISGPVRDIFLNSRQDATRGGYGLRLRLKLSDAPELASLPWEYLYDGRAFLAVSRTTPLVRYLDLPHPPRPMGVKPPLRILITISAPHDQPPLDVDIEKAKVQKALAPLEERRLIEVDVASDARLPTLHRTMRRARRRGCPYHVWHYIGHGGFDPVGETSVLAFCDQNNRSDTVDGLQLGTLFNGFPQMRLVLLNACEGARPDARDPFAGVAAALVERGVPAVIGMQFEISDEAAHTLAEEFYQALAGGLPVDAALSEARQAVFFLPNWIEWATPVLLTRSPDGQLFDISVPAQTGAPPKGAEMSRTDSEPEQLATLYSDALGAFFADQWQRAIEILSEIVSRQENYKDAAAKLAEAQRRKRLADLYANARRLRQRQNQAAIAVLERIEALDPTYPDPEGLLTSLRRERKLADLYSRGLDSMNAETWSDALGYFQEISQLQADYRETEALLVRAQRELVDSGALPDLLTFTDPIHLELVRVPGGEFLMGSDKACDPDALDDEQPMHRVHVAGFYIGKYPVTNTQYAAFVSLSGHTAPLHWKTGAIPRGRENHPVVYVSCQDAVAFYKWLSRQTDQSFRLPTEAEWEKAARGVDGRIYPWGDEWDPNRCNTKESGIEATSPVGLHSPEGDSPCGAADMAGNVMEWCQSLHEAFPYQAADGREDLWARGNRVLRGGSFSTPQLAARCAWRQGDAPISRYSNVSFRVVLALDSPGTADVLASERIQSKEGKLADLYSRGLDSMNAENWSDALEYFQEISQLQAGYRETEALLVRAQRELVNSGALPNLLTITDPFYLELVHVPAGGFLMGSDGRRDPYALDTEKPRHRVHVVELHIGKYPVTNTQYAAFVNATGHRAPFHWRYGAIPKGKKNHPVVHVTWRDAVAFCRWLSQQTSRPFRLPTEAEWEKAARGVDGRVYPWGNKWDSERCNAGRWSSYGATSPVGQYSPEGDSPCGAVDMAGNVWEWTSSVWGTEPNQPDFKYPYRVEDGRENQSMGDEVRRVLRGGAWSSAARDVRCACRFNHLPDLHFDTGSVGFRVVLALKPAISDS